MFEILLEKMKLDHFALMGFLQMAGLDSRGDFLVIVNMVGENSPRRARVNFNPSSEITNIIHHVAEQVGNVEMMERLEIRRNDGTGGFVRVFPMEDVPTEFK